LACILKLIDTCISLLSFFSNSSGVCHKSPKNMKTLKLATVRRMDLLLSAGEKGTGETPILLDSVGRAIPDLSTGLPDATE
jgi:hypothetical protein